MVKSMNVSWWVDRWAALHPRKTAILFEGEETSYLQLSHKAGRAALWLQDLGVETGDRVAVLLSNCLEFIELYLACAKIGAIFVPLNFRLVSSEVDYILTNGKPKLFVYGIEYTETIEPLPISFYRPRLCLAKVGESEGVYGSRDYSAEVAATDAKLPSLPHTPGPSDPEELQVIMYTSGTTGNPKGAALSYRKTFFNCLNAEIFFKLSFDDVMLVVLPLFHSGGLFIMTSPCLYKGATIVLHPRFDPLKTYSDIEKHRVTKFLGVPTVFRDLLKISTDERGKITSLKICAIGGEKVTPELVEECGRNGFIVRQIMGQTETSILLWASEEETHNRPGTVGRPVFHAEVRLVDSEGNPVQQGETGEIVARGSILMTEYWDDPVQTEATIRDGWLHTGDLARQDEDGYIYLVDRARDMYISGGENVYPAEIERVVGQHPSIADVALLGVPDEKWGEVGHLYCECEPGSSTTEEDVICWCRERLASYKVPKKVTFCTSFPRTSVGKVRKFLLRGIGEE